LEAGSRHRHVTRGTSYEVVGVATLNNATAQKLECGAQLVVYVGTADGQLWAREAGEFSDGRFWPVAKPEACCDDDDDQDEASGERLDGARVDGILRGCEAGWKRAVWLLLWAHVMAIGFWLSWVRTD
jgi:hypothetical protein